MGTLETRLEELRADFEAVTGRPFKHFYCPVLHVDQDVPLARGHVIPKSLGGTSKVLQREDVDNEFGSLFEAEAADAIRWGLDEGPIELAVGDNPKELEKTPQRFKLHVLLDGVEDPVRVRLVKMGKEMILRPGNEDSNDALKNLRQAGEIRGRLLAELDARSSILVTSLRSTHLWSFQKCGYRYVFSNEGVFVAWVLRSIYEKIIEMRKTQNGAKARGLSADRVKAEVNHFCLQFSNIIRPVPQSLLETLPNEIQKGTPDSGWFIVLWDGNEIYGRISILKLGGQHAAVMTPLITDTRGWALIDVAANLELEFSFARLNSETSAFEVAPPIGKRLIWPSAKDEARSAPTLNIRQARQAVIQSGRMG